MFNKLVKTILQREKRSGQVDVSLVDDQVIWKLNQRFRGKNRPTDVLAFSYGSDGMLGDVIISSETARKNARSFGVSYRQELKRLVVHGVLHVLGYDHGKRMSYAEKIYQKS